MAKLYHLVRQITPTTGTGTVALGAAVAGHYTFTRAGVVDGEIVRYTIVDGAAVEIGRGVYSAAPQTLTRSVIQSTNGNRLLELSGAAEVYISDIGGGNSAPIPEPVTITEGPGIDLVGSQIGVGLDSILLVKADGSPATEHASITAACAAAVSGDTVFIARAGTFAESFTIPAGVTVLGIGESAVIIQGIVTLSAGATLSRVSLPGIGSMSGLYAPVVRPASGAAWVRNCIIDAQNANASGSAAVVSGSGGDVTLMDCTLRARVDGVDVNPLPAVPGTGKIELTGASPTLPDGVTMAYLATLGTHINGSTKVTSLVRGSPIMELTFESGWVIETASVSYRSGSMFTYTSGWGIVYTLMDGTEHFVQGPQVANSATLNDTYSCTAKKITFIGPYFTAFASSGTDLHTMVINAAGADPAAGGSGAVVIDNSMTILSGVPHLGDRAATRASAYPSLHADDVDHLAGIHHTLGTGSGQAAAGDHTHDVTDFGSGDATDGYVLTADGAGGAAWEAPGAAVAESKMAIFTFIGTLTVSDNDLILYNVLGRTLTISRVFLSSKTGPAGSAIIADLHKNGVTVFTNQAHRPQIAAGANTGETTTIDVATWAAGEYLTAHIDQIGSGTAGANLVMHIVYS